MRVFRFPLRHILRSCTVFLRSPSPRQWLCSTSAPVAQFPESSKERVLELADHFQSQSRFGSKYIKHLDEFREWARKNNEPPHSKMLEVLFSMCVRSRKASDVEIALEFADTHGVQLGEGQINAVITNLAKFGDYARTKEIFQKTDASGTDFRITSLCALLQRAASERDFPFMLSLEGQLSRHRKTLKNHKLVEETLKPVFQECTSVKDPAVHEVARVMIDTYRNTRQKPGRETAEVLCQWFKKYVPFPWYSQLLGILVSRPSHVFQCTQEKSGRPGRFCVVMIAYLPPFQPRFEHPGNVCLSAHATGSDHYHTTWCPTRVCVDGNNRYQLCGWVSNHYITNWSGLPNFLVFVKLWFLDIASYPGLPTWEKLGRRDRSGDVIGCSLRCSCVSPPTHLCSWSRGDSWLHSLRERVGGDTQPHLKPHLITLPDWPRLPNFYRIGWKTWEGLGTRLAACE